MRDNGNTTDNRVHPCRPVLDVILLIALVIPIVLLEYVLVDPPRRGFFCSDETIRYPLQAETISAKNAIIFCVFVPIFIMIVAELTIHNNQNSSQRKVSLFGFKFSSWIPEFSQHFMFFTFGFLVTIIMSGVGKFTIGRLRPHFMAVCQPQMLDGSTCEAPQNQLRYIEDYVCVAEGYTANDLNRARVSFPSAHSSLSFYAMVYISIYLQHKWTWNGSKVLCHILQVILIASATFTALTRIMDNWHHWSDVLSGSVLGMAIAVLIARYVTKDFSQTHFGYRPEFNQRDTNTTLNECGGDVEV